MANISVAATGQASISRSALVAKSPGTLSYDADGNLTQDRRWLYTWDAENPLIAVESSSDAPPASRRRRTALPPTTLRPLPRIGRDAFHRVPILLFHIRDLVEQVPTTTGHCATDSRLANPARVGQIGFTNNGTWRMTTTHAYDNVNRLMEISSAPSGTNAGTYFCAYDGNGNVMALVSAADGSVAARYEYGPFGEVIRATGPMAEINPFRSSTKYHDDETGLVYYGYRYYDPGTGRWLSRDPINENGGVNLYGFVRNDPVRRFDALGQADGAVGWPYPDPKPGEPPPSYPPPMPFPQPPSKMFKKLDCSCCGEKEINAGLDELKRRFGSAQSFLDKRLKPSDMDPNGATSCAASNERVLQFIEPTPRCWICFMDRRWDKDPNNPPRGGGTFWDENFIHCFTVNPNGIQKEIVFDYFEYRYYNGKKGNGTYEGGDLDKFNKRHPYPGQSQAGGYPRFANCNEPDKKWNPDYGTFAPLGVSQ